MNMDKPLNRLNVQAFDLFCGVGGLTYGLQKVGITVKAGADMDGSCRFAYEKNSGATFIESDIKDMNFSDITPYFNHAQYLILVGCAPCQPFSTHTNKKKDASLDSRWHLLNEFLRIILEGMPTVVLMENVPQIQNKPIYAKFKRTLKKAGYEISDGTVSCLDFGVPQNRKRLIMLASVLGKIDLPKPNTTNPKTVRQTIGNLEALEQGQSSQADLLHVCARLEATNLKRIQTSKPGGSWKDWPIELLPNCYKRESGATYPSVYGRMEWDKPAPTLTTQFYRYGTGRYGHPEQNRALSLREGALLQTFPEHYQFLPPGEEVSFTKIGRHIGNAVPPALATAIGQVLRNHFVQAGEDHV